MLCTPCCACVGESPVYCNPDNTYSTSAAAWVAAFRVFFVFCSKPSFLWPSLSLTTYSSRNSNPGSHCKFSSHTPSLPPVFPTAVGALHFLSPTRLPPVDSCRIEVELRSMRSVVLTFVFTLCSTLNRFCPVRTGVPFWGQSTQNVSGLFPERDCSPKRAEARRQVSKGFLIEPMIYLYTWYVVRSIYKAFLRSGHSMGDARSTG